MAIQITLPSQTCERSWSGVGYTHLIGWGGWTWEKVIQKKKWNNIFRDSMHYMKRHNNIVPEEGVFRCIYIYIITEDMTYDLSR